jgi:lipopolysaccharide biosynthesis glycosyltransferase
MKEEALKKEDRLAICMVADPNYYPHVCALILSILTHYKGAFSMYIFDDSYNAKKFSVLKEWIQDKYALELKHVVIDKTLLEKYSGQFWKVLNERAMYRLLIPNFLPEQYSRALYLDSDMIVVGDFNLNDYNLQGKTIAAVQDSVAHILAADRGLVDYFNSGLLLIDTVKWKTENTLQKLLAFKPKTMLFADQELLNGLFEHDWVKLKATLNFPASSLKFKGLKLRSVDGESPKILHYLGPLKPWNYWLKGSMSYWKYILLSPYRSSIFSVPLTLFRSIQHLFKSRVLKKLKGKH